MKRNTRNLARVVTPLDRAAISAISGALRRGLFEGAVRASFRRSFHEMQPDELERYSAVAPAYFEGFYSSDEIAQSRISAQFLNEDEPVAIENRELMLRIESTWEDGTPSVFYEIISDESSYLGFLHTPWLYEVSIGDELHILSLSVNGYKVLALAVPDWRMAYVFILSREHHQYIYAFTASL